MTDRGFTILEVLLTLALLASVMVALVQSFGGSTRLLAVAEAETQMTHVAEEIMTATLAGLPDAALCAESYDCRVLRERFSADTSLGIDRIAVTVREFAGGRAVTLETLAEARQ